MRLRRTLTLQLKSTSRFGDFRSLWMMGGLSECRCSMPLAASSSCRREQAAVGEQASGHSVQFVARRAAWYPCSAGAAWCVLGIPVFGSPVKMRRTMPSLRCQESSAACASMFLASLRTLFREPLAQYSAAQRSAAQVMPTQSKAGRTG